MKVTPTNQGEHYRPLADRLVEVASALGMENISASTSGLDYAEVVVQHPVSKARSKWVGTIQNRSDDSIVKAFTIWLASVR